MHLDKVSILLAMLYLCNGYEVLLVFPVPGKSHSILGEGYVRHLLATGHKITYLTAKLIEDPPAGLRQIDLSEGFKYLPKDLVDVKKYLCKEVNYQGEPQLIAMFDHIFNKTFRIDSVQNFLKEKNTYFDVAVVDWLYSELGVGFSSVFNCPLIWSSSMDVHTTVLGLIDEHPNPAYTRHHLSTEYSFSFWNRVNELWTISMTLFYNWWQSEEHNRMFQEIFGPAAIERGIQLPHFYEVRYNASLMLGNSHIVIGDAIALPQNYWHIGGYHIKDKVDPLPKDLKKIMDEAKHGVVYFSLGSILQVKKMPNKIKKQLLDVFSELKQNVIWKLDQEIMDLPKNVHLVSWAPQQSILAHTNCVLFISHGGLLSILETLKYGVPIIGIPFFADQHLNTNKIVSKGFGKRLEISENTPEELRVTLREVLGNSSYRSRVKELSSLFNANSNPGQRLVEGVELVGRTHGAPHFQSVALHVPFYQKFFLDLLLLLICILVVVIAVILYISQFLALSCKKTNIKNKQN